MSAARAGAAIADQSVVAALGAGRMGRGIAQAFAFAGHPVLLIDLKGRAQDAARELERSALMEISENLEALAELGAFDASLIAGTMDRIRFVFAPEAANAVANAGLAFECVPEVLDAKQSALEFAGRHLPEDAVLASTTSTFLSTELAGCTSRPGRFLNAHWLNPAFLIPLVELSPHPGTAPDALDNLHRTLTDIGKTPVICAPAPGYIVPRLQVLLMNEVARLIEQGIASAEEIDRATRRGLGVRYAGMGVAEFIDYGGNETLHYASRYLSEALDDDRYAAPRIIEDNMRAGRNGLREGVGLYDWSETDKDAYRRDVLARLVRQLRSQNLLPKAAAN
ncbi:MAG: 3-hydroxybutyryl-CoA dehydrogenase [Gammaproteobacteria bacterium]|nr:3-hydroxybutyryl-CoA dehydrogenase [Gammaproteobacteria bacterium]MDE0414196.1 3-hydroxybutyryl-CoA dehydrogenase [Gammaproteobacteria bacterium]MDE0455383.1 3-hydroxybutyryl-CoA dehydrogenase [Gammaproteobacteria bacterium]